MISRSSPTYEKPTSQRRLGSHHFLGMAFAGQQQGAVQEGHGTAVRELQGCHSWIRTAGTAGCPEISQVLGLPSGMNGF